MLMKEVAIKREAVLGVEHPHTKMSWRWVAWWKRLMEYDQIAVEPEGLIASSR